MEICYLFSTARLWLPLHLNLPDYHSQSYQAPSKSQTLLSAFSPQPYPIPPFPFFGIPPCSPGPGSPHLLSQVLSPPQPQQSPRPTRSLTEATWGWSTPQLVWWISVSPPLLNGHSQHPTQFKLQFSVLWKANAWGLAFLLSCSGLFSLPFSSAFFCSHSLSLLFCQLHFLQTQTREPVLPSLGGALGDVLCPIQNLSTPSFTRPVSSRPPFIPDYVFSCTHFLCLLLKKKSYQLMCMSIYNPILQIVAVENGKKNFRSVKFH